MGRLASAWFVVVSLLHSSSSLADTPRFATTFRFEVRFADTVLTYNDNQMMAVNVFLPAALGWQCVRNVPGLVEGRRRGSFACSNDGWRTEVLTIAGCKATGPDPLRTAGMRLFAARPDGRPQGSPVADAGADAATGFPFGQWVDLAVSCETVATR
jgi:hypothetical protein